MIPIGDVETPLPVIRTVMPIGAVGTPVIVTHPVVVRRDKPRLRGGHAPQSRSPSDDDIDMDMDPYRDSFRGRGDSRNRDSYPDSYGDSRNGDSSRRREDSRDDLDSHRADGEYCAIETGHKRSRNSNYGQYEAGKMHRSKDFDPRPRRK